MFRSCTRYTVLVHTVHTVHNNNICIEHVSHAASTCLLARNLYTILTLHYRGSVTRFFSFFFHESNPDGLDFWKNRGRKSRETASLMSQCLESFEFITLVLCQSANYWFLATKKLDTIFHWAKQKIICNELFTPNFIAKLTIWAPYWHSELFFEYGFDFAEI